MVRFRGEFDSKVDSKGRFLLPVNLKKQLPEDANSRFVMNCGFEGCLNLFPLSEWEKIEEKLDELDMYDPDDREFMRMFTSGLTDLELDSSGRLLIPKRLLKWANIEKEIVLMAQFNRIEVWDSKRHIEAVSVDPKKYSGLGKVVMGKNSNSSNDANLP
ncbi:MAG: division/cell wall cluster transcriptional repressor MraZ [Bacteroidia bacterium]|nr:division/cell wall cluster transcriptional repressor MraZ [Bacteroidia bacterium]